MIWKSLSAFLLTYISSSPSGVCFRVPCPKANTSFIHISGSKVCILASRWVLPSLRSSNRPWAPEKEGDCFEQPIQVYMNNLFSVYMRRNHQAATQQRYFQLRSAYFPISPYLLKIKQAMVEMVLEYIVLEPTQEAVATFGPSSPQIGLPGPMPIYWLPCQQERL